MRVPVSTRFRQHWLRRWLRIANSWRGRILLTTICLALAPALAVTLAIAFSQAREAIQSRSIQLRDATLNVATELDRDLDSHRRITINLATGIALVGLADRAAVEAHVLRAAAWLPALDTVGVADANGTIIAMSRRAERDAGFEAAPFAGQSIADRDYFSVPLATARSYVSNVFAAHDAKPGESTFAVSAPIVQGGKVIGVVFGQELASGLAGFERAGVRADEATVVVLDREQSIAYASASLGLTPLSPASSAPWLAEILARDPSGSRGASLIGTSPSLFDGEHGLHAAQLTSQGWTVLLTGERLTTGAIVMQFLQRVVPILVLASLAAILLAYQLSLTIMRPLSQVLQRVESFSMDGSQSHFRRIGALPIEYLRMVRRLHRMAWRLNAWQHQLRAALADAKRARSEVINVLVTREDEVRERTRELAEANAALERLSRVDPLTGIANRRWFAEALDREWRSCLRDRKQITVLFVDVDHYKSFNDKYGHQAGDDCLVRVAQALQASLYRPHDLLARYGGEEFAAVVTGVTVADAMRLGERLRAAVEALGIRHEGSRVHGVLTASVGVATLTPDPAMSAEWLLRLADQALYVAKDGGRNVVSMMGADGLAHSGTDLPQENGPGIDDTGIDVTRRIPALTG